MEFQGKPGPVQAAESSIQVLDRFQRIQTALEHVELFGKDPEPFNDGQMVKHWADPNAMSVRGDWVTYEIVEVDENGNPSVGQLKLPKAIAARYNIPSQRDTILNPYGLPTCPMPIRRLVPPEELGRARFNGVPIVVNRALLETELQKDPLVRIEAKLDQILAKL